MCILPNRASAHELSQLGHLPHRQELYRTLFQGHHTEYESVFQVAVQSAFSIKAEGLDNVVYLLEGEQVLKHSSSSNSKAEAREQSVSSLLIAEQQSPPHERIVERLRGPEGLPVRQLIRQLLSRLDHSQASEREAIMQAFYAEAEPLVVKIFAGEGKGEGEGEGEGQGEGEEANRAMDFIEGYLLGKRPKLLWMPLDSDDPLLDRLLCDRLKAMEHTPATQLGLPIEIEERLLEGPCEALRLLQGQAQPVDKAQALLLLNQRAAEALATLQLSTGADGLLPFLLLVMIRIQPEHLVSCLHFLTRCRRRSAMRGEYAYAVTNLQAIVQYLETPLDGDGHAYGSGKKALSPPIGISGGGGGGETSAIMNSFNTVMDRITFVPRAIGSAVVDTFRSRQQQQQMQNRSLSVPSLEPVPQPVVSASAPTMPTTTTTTTPPAPSDLQALRERVSQRSFRELSIEDVEKAIEDYKQLIAGD